MSNGERDIVLEKRLRSSLETTAVSLSGTNAKAIINRVLTGGLGGLIPTERVQIEKSLRGNPNLAAYLLACVVRGWHSTPSAKRFATFR